MSIYITEIQVPRPSQLGGDHWHLEGFTDITVLFGKNSSGKSLLLRAWRDQNVESTHYVTPERIGEMTFEPGQIQTQQNPEGRRQQSQRNYSPNYRQQVITRITTYFAIRGGYRGHKSPSGDPSEMERLLGLLIPDFTISLSPTTTPPYELHRLSSEEKVAGVHELSSGEAQILTLGLDIITIAAIWDLEQKEQRILLIDEPDAHIHPDLQTRFSDFIRKVANKFGVQVIIATHTTTLLSALGQLSKDRTSVIYLDRARSRFRAQPFDKVRREIAACLGGHMLMGPLFAVPLLLVEGDDDCRIWSQVPRHHKISVSVIPCEGEEIKKYQKSLERIFTSLAEPPAQPFGYALLDGDTPLPQPNPDNPQRYIRYIRLNCHEAENLYLTDEVLQDLGLSWPEAVKRIVDKREKYGEKAELLETAASWDRQNHDLKRVINELSDILDDKNVHWTTRVGHRIGRERPRGQLMDFLGLDIMTYLWGNDEEG